MTISASEYAAMADGAYGPVNGADPLYKMISYGRGSIAKDDFSVLESSDYSTVYKKNSTGEVVLAIKGTNRAGDWASNFLVTLGALEADPRMMALVNIVGKYRRQGVEISATGHSLGGALAAELAKNYHVMAVTFNMGSFVSELLPDHVAMSLVRKERPGNIIQFNTGTDPLSVTGPSLHTGSKVFYVGGAPIMSSHSMSSFSSLDDSLYQRDIDDKEKGVNDYRAAHPEIDDSGMSTVQYSERVFEVVGKTLAAYKTIVVWADLMKKAVQNRGIFTANLRRALESARKRIKGFGVRLNRLKDAFRNNEPVEVEEEVELLRQETVSMYDDASLRNLVDHLTRGPSEGRVEWDSDGAWDAAQEQVEMTDRSNKDFDDYDEMEEYDDAGGVDDEFDDDPDFFDEGEGLGLDADATAEIEPIEDGDVGDFFPDFDGVGEGESFGVEGMSAGDITEVSGAAELGMGMAELGVVGGAFYGIFLVYESIEAGERANALVAHVGERNANFDATFRRSTLGAGVVIPVNRVPALLGFPWRNADLYGDVTFAYLNWRIATPEAMYVGGGLELDVLGAMYRKYLSPGVPLVADDAASFHLMTGVNTQRDLLAQWMNSSGGMSGYMQFANGWGTQRFMEIFSGFSGYLVDTNSQAYLAELTAFMGQHKTHKFDELDALDQQDWVARLEDGLSVGVHSYVTQIMELPSYVQSIPGNMYAEDMKVAMESLKAHVVSLLTKYGDRADAMLLAFQKTHALAILHRGIEKVTAGGGQTGVWLDERGEDMKTFQTYFSLGAVELLSGPPRSVDEYTSIRNLTQHQIDEDVIDYSWFLAEGQKERGDNESLDEFSDRFDRWQSERARSEALDTHRAHSYEEYINQIKARAALRGQSESRGVVVVDEQGVSHCAARPRKRKALDAVTWVDRSRRGLAPQTS